MTGENHRFKPQILAVIIALGFGMYVSYISGQEAALTACIVGLATIAYKIIEADKGPGP